MTPRAPVRQVKNSVVCEAFEYLLIIIVVIDKSKGKSVHSTLGKVREILPFCNQNELLKN